MRARHYPCGVPMAETTFASPELWQRLDHGVEQLAKQVRRRIPSLHYSIQRGSNDSFPWWVVARFADGTDQSKLVDVSIDCQGTSREWTIHADIAREDGLVLEELSPIESTHGMNGMQLVSPMESLVHDLEAFLSQQAERIVQELEEGDASA